MGLRSHRGFRGLQFLARGAKGSDAMYVSLSI